MSGETYTILFNTQGKNVISTGTNGQNCTFYVNWASILPSDKQKYRCQFVFKSSNTATPLTSNYLININMGRPQVYDGTTQTYNLGFCYPVICGSTYWLTSTNNDNNDITISAISNNTVNVSLLSFDGVSAPSIPVALNWTLILNLEPIY